MATAPLPLGPAAPLIGGQYAVDLARRMDWAGGGVPAFAATDRATGSAAFMALQATPRFPPRAGALKALSGPIEGLLTPLAHGPGPGPAGEATYYVICPAPSGPPLAGSHDPWPEHALLEQVLRPATLALEQLQRDGVTHRAIRPDNMFHRPGQPVELGAAWAAPPALLQPALFEPPYVAMCLPSGRGEGTIADDVYALGVLLIVLALGRLPLAGQPDPAIIRRKLALGSFAALAGEERLPSTIADLARGMLAEDPEHRPPPSLLLNPVAARSRRVAARPAHRSQRPLLVGDIAAWDARTLAYAMAVAPEHGVQALRSGALLQWLRRSLGDGALVVRVEDAVRHRLAAGAADEERGAAAIVLCVIALLDPLAPLAWRGLVLWPDGIGTAMAEAQAADSSGLSVLLEMVRIEAAGSWASARPDRCDAAQLRATARSQRAWILGRGTSGWARLAYALNPLVPCASPLLAGRWVARLPDLPAALEAVAATVDRKLAGPFDGPIADFVAARSERHLDLQDTADPREAAAGGTFGGSFGLPQLRLLVQLQTRYHPGPLPVLAAWVADCASPMIAAWASRSRRAAIEARLQELAPAGSLAPMLAVIDDPDGRGADAGAAQVAAAELARIDAELAGITDGGPARDEAAVKFGQEIAAGVGLTALATVLAIAALG
jgi:hypothetical protein